MSRFSACINHRIDHDVMRLMKKLATPAIFFRFPPRFASSSTPAM